MTCLEAIMPYSPSEIIFQRGNKNCKPVDKKSQKINVHSLPQN